MGSSSEAGTTDMAAGTPDPDTSATAPGELLRETQRK